MFSLRKLLSKVTWGRWGEGGKKTSSRFWVPARGLMWKTLANTVRTARVSWQSSWHKAGCLHEPHMWGGEAVETASDGRKKGETWKLPIPWMWTGLEQRRSSMNKSCYIENLRCVMIISFLPPAFKDFSEKRNEKLCGWEKAFAFFATTSLSIYSGGGWGLVLNQRILQDNNSWAIGRGRACVCNSILDTMVSSSRGTGDSKAILKLKGPRKISELGETVQHVNEMVTGWHFQKEKRKKL